MEIPELTSLLRKGVGSWNKWRKRQERDALNLLSGRSANIKLEELAWGEQFQKLIEVNLTNADLRRADLRGAMLGSPRRLMHTLEQHGLDSGHLETISKPLESI